MAVDVKLHEEYVDYFGDKVKIVNGYWISDMKLFIGDNGLQYDSSGRCVSNRSFVFDLSKTLKEHVNSHHAMNNIATEVMSPEKIEKLEAAGWTVGSADDFLNPNIKLEVGKEYKNRKGETILITSYDERYGHFPFRAVNGDTFALDGSWQIGSEYDLDLIGEVEPLADLTEMLGKYHHRQITEREFRDFVAEFLNAEN